MRSKTVVLGWAKIEIPARTHTADRQIEQKTIKTTLLHIQNTFAVVSRWWPMNACVLHSFHAIFFVLVSSAPFIALGIFRITTIEIHTNNEYRERGKSTTVLLSPCHWFWILQMLTQWDQWMWELVLFCFFFCLSVGKQRIWHRCIVQSQSRVVDTGQEKWWSVVSGLATHLKYCYWPSGDDWKKRKSFCDSMNESIALRPTSVDFSLINYMSHMHVNETMHDIFFCSIYVSHY